MENISVTQQDAMAVLTINGEITLDKAAAMKKKVEQATSAMEFDTMLIDLSSVTFIDSSGIGFLVALKTKTTSLGKNLYLTGLTEEIRKTFELVQLMDFFQIVDSADDIL